MSSKLKIFCPMLLVILVLALLHARNVLLDGAWKEFKSHEENPPGPDPFFPKPLWFWASFSPTPDARGNVAHVAKLPVAHVAHTFPKLPVAHVAGGINRF